MKIGSVEFKNPIANAKLLKGLLPSIVGNRVKALTQGEGKKPVIKQEPNKANWSYKNQTWVGSMPKYNYQFVKNPTPFPKIAESTPTPKEPYVHHIPTGNPNQPEVPQNLAQIFMEELDKDKVATDSARMMSHSSQNTRTPAEMKRMGGPNINIGENPYFKPEAVNPNKDGTMDYGLGMINDATLAEMLSKPFWKNRLANRGVDVKNISDATLADPRTNLKIMLTRLEYGNWDNKNKKMKEKPNYMPWYAAPLDLRTR
jgi:hypothetical protein